MKVAVDVGGRSTEECAGGAAARHPLYQRRTLVAAPPGGGARAARRRRAPRGALSRRPSFASLSTHYGYLESDIPLTAASFRVAEVLRRVAAAYRADGRRYIWGSYFLEVLKQGTRMPPYVNLPRSSKSRNPLLGSPTIHTH
ncbi:hypothetical protein EVAR_87987_1 [Eumeta japonica]|uniref:Uncharacterized protein n=1 Tax=Eumeta variegata TaxID=151549 RepID=A0A4C1VB83_EUMVA|nr:hypothetical protein EVAR_87987_1 [Eumeta japonica]